MTKTNFVFFDAERDCCDFVFGDGYSRNREHSTNRISHGRYVRDDAGKQICDGGGSRGWTLEWFGEGEDGARNFAKQCDARFYKTRAGFDRAVAEMYGDEPTYA